MKLITNSSCYDEEKFILQSDGHFTRHNLTLQTKWSTKHLWQWMIHYTNIMLVIVHCPRYTDIHDASGVGPGPIFMWLDVTVTNQLTNSFKPSPSWEGNSHSTSKEIPSLLWNPKVHFCV
jgi:hypothetical protein